MSNTTPIKMSNTTPSKKHNIMSQRYDNAYSITNYEDDLRRELRVLKLDGDACDTLRLIYQWVRSNKKNQKLSVKKRGTWWTFISMGQIADQLGGHLSRHSIARRLNKLVKLGLICRERLHPNTHNRTYWYSIGRTFIDLFKNVRLKAINAMREAAQCLNDSITKDSNIHQQSESDFLKMDETKKTPKTEHPTSAEKDQREPAREKWEHCGDDNKPFVLVNCYSKGQIRPFKVSVLSYFLSEKYEPGYEIIQNRYGDNSNLKAATAQFLEANEGCTYKTPQELFKHLSNYLKKAAENGFKKEKKPKIIGNKVPKWDRKAGKSKRLQTNGAKIKEVTPGGRDMAQEYAQIKTDPMPAPKAKTWGERIREKWGGKNGDK